MSTLAPAELRALMRVVERVLAEYKPPVLAPGYIEDWPDGELYVASGAVMDACFRPLRHCAHFAADGTLLWEGCG